MNKEDYLNAVVNQMRCKQARDMIKEEIGNHIEDQAQAYIDMGMEVQKAREQAIKEMGDPIETGVSLDRIHRPKMAWQVLSLIAVISLVSILVQFLIYRENIVEESYYFYNQLIYMGVGFGIMLLIYFIDYSIIGKYAREIAFVFCGIIFICVFFIAINVNGVSEYIAIGPLSISLRMIMYLYTPIYGAILYQYRGEKYRGLLKAFVWLLLPVWLSLQMPCASLGLNMFIILLLLLTVAITKNWFQINKKLVLISIWGAVVLFPVTMVSMVLSNVYTFLATYQESRILTLFFPGNYELGYQIANVREIISNSKILGNSGLEIEAYQHRLPYTTSDYLLTYIISYYGILVAIGVVLLIIVLVRSIIKISFVQKNQIGMMMGLDCGLVFGIQTVTFVLQNTGLYPSTLVFLPLFSFGATGTIVSYILLGILLSIYRYQNILSSKAPKRKRIKVTFVEN